MPSGIGNQHLRNVSVSNFNNLQKSQNVSADSGLISTSPGRVIGQSKPSPASIGAPSIFGNNITSNSVPEHVTSPKPKPQTNVMGLKTAYSTANVYIQAHAPPTHLVSINRFPDFMAFINFFKVLNVIFPS